MSAISTRLGSDTETVDFGSLRISIDHSIETSRAVYYGVYEEHLVNWLARRLRPGDKVIEPGMNAGFITSQILNAIGSRGLLVSLEPSRTCCRRLAADNQLSDRSNFVLLNAALSSTCGVEGFYESTRIITRGFSCLESAGTPSDAVRYEIETYSVDELMRTHGIERLRFLKLDIEGSELPAIEGAQGALAAGAIDFIMVETDIDPNSDALRSTNERIASILRRAGMAPHRMHRSGTLTEFDIERALEGRDRIRTDLMWVTTRRQGK